jgi:hypothetical protein
VGGGRAAVATVVEPAAWTLHELDGLGDLTAYGGWEAVEASLPLATSWSWVVEVGGAVRDLWWLDAEGQDRDGAPLRVRCFDGAWWEVTGSPATEAAVAAALPGAEQVAGPERVPDGDG